MADTQEQKQQEQQQQQEPQPGMAQWPVSTYLEHANITVPSIDEAVSFLMLIDPSFVVRRDETPEGSYRWCHIGNDRFYIALQEPHLGSTPEDRRTPYKNFGVNHLAFVVADLDAVVARLEEAGTRQSVRGENRSGVRKRAYYYMDGGDGAASLEFEIVQYLTDDPAARNTYEAA